MNTANNPLIRAIELQNSGRLDEATVLFRQILAANPNDAAALFSLGVILVNGGKGAEALPLAERGVVLAPHFAPMWCMRAAALQSQERKVEALESFDRALAIDPNNIDTLLNSGALLRDMLRHLEALQRFNRILEIDPDHVPALANCGILLTEFKRSQEAIAMFQRLLALKPDFDYGLGLLCYERLHAGDWTDFDAMKAAILDGVHAGRRVCKTLALMGITDSVTAQFLAARIFAYHRYPKAEQPIRPVGDYGHQRLRIAYVSPDLREHPVGHLMAGIFERHDKSRFETIAISLGPNDGSRLRARMEAAFDHFIDVRDMGSRQIAQLMRDMEVDVAIDLAGYTSDSRAEIFSYRPAPVQVNYLGYPGTLGLPYMDWILADRHVIPPEHQPFFSEQVFYLPHAYLPTDAGIRISERTPSRAECGLPEEGVVFCSFSHDYKISPPVFDVWMNLLRQVPGSVLWLASKGELTQRNLRREAEARGVAGERLVFAGRVPLVEDHLARYRQADIFLDTHPYNAHTTAADALMAGLPVVTFMGNAFPARVAGSLLHAIGLPELVADSLAGYETLALDLARNPDRLSGIKARLQANLSTHPLFDTDSFCRHVEDAYGAMWRQFKAGQGGN